MLPGWAQMRARAKFWWNKNVLNSPPLRLSKKLNMQIPKIVGLFWQKIWKIRYYLRSIKTSKPNSWFWKYFSTSFAHLIATIMKKFIFISNISVLFHTKVRNPHSNYSLCDMSSLEQTCFQKKENSSKVHCKICKH